MARGWPYLLLSPVLLALLAPGSWGSAVVPEEVHGVVGQTLSVRCQYTPERGPYVMKTWCRQTSPQKCTRLVTTSQPRKAVEVSRHIIWDDPETGFFVITVTQLREEDAGSYWCGSFNSSRKVVIILRVISLVLSPAPSTSPLPATTWLPTGTVLISSPEGTSDPSVNGSEHRKSNSSSSSSSSSVAWASLGLLVPVQYGLLVLKGLALLALCGLLGCSCCQGGKDTVETAMMEFSDYASPNQAPERLGAFSHIPGYRKSTWSSYGSHP